MAQKLNLLQIDALPHFPLEGGRLGTDREPYPYLIAFPRRFLSCRKHSLKLEAEIDLVEAGMVGWYDAFNSTYYGFDFCCNGVKAVIWRPSYTLPSSPEYNDYKRLQRELDRIEIISLCPKPITVPVTKSPITPINLSLSEFLQLAEVSEHSLFAEWREEQGIAGAAREEDFQRWLASIHPSDLSFSFYSSPPLRSYWEELDLPTKSLKFSLEYTLSDNTMTWQIGDVKLARQLHLPDMRFERRWETGGREYLGVISELLPCFALPAFAPIRLHKFYVEY